MLSYKDNKREAIKGVDLSKYNGAVDFNIGLGGFPLCLSWLRILLQYDRPGLDHWVGKTSWRRAWQPTPVFLSGESTWTEEPGGLQSMGLQRVGHE